MKTKFESARVIPILIFENADVAVGTAGALIEGGLEVLEVTLRTDASWGALEMIIEQFPNALTGVGTVFDIHEMKRASDLGAAFAMSPGLDPHLVECARALGLYYLPGVTTPSEVMRARDLDLDAMKFFPAVAASLHRSRISPFVPRVESTRTMRRVTWRWTTCSVSEDPGWLPPRICGREIGRASRTRRLRQEVFL